MSRRMRPLTWQEKLVARLEAWLWPAEPRVELSVRPAGRTTRQPRPRMSDLLPEVEARAQRASTSAQRTLAEILGG